MSFVAYKKYHCEPSSKMGASVFATGHFIHVPARVDIYVVELVRTKFAIDFYCGKMLMLFALRGMC